MSHVTPGPTHSAFLFMDSSSSDGVSWLHIEDIYFILRFKDVSAKSPQASHLNIWEHLQSDTI